jgi:hypothetical protein
MCWVIGDWWRFGHRYGERKAMVESENWRGPSFQTCEDYAWVCGRFETSRRREVLSFGHHREVAALPPAEQDRLLDWCLETEPRRSVRALRDEVTRRRDEDLERRGWTRERVKQALYTPAPTTANMAALLPRFVSTVKRDLWRRRRSVAQVAIGTAVTARRVAVRRRALGAGCYGKIAG